MQIVRKLEPEKIIDYDYKIAVFFLTQQLFVYHDAPDVPVKMVASLDCLDGETCNMSRKV